MFEITAYHKWLLRESAGNRNLLAMLIYRDLLSQGEMTFELMAHAGETVYNEDSCLKAADYLLKQDK